MERRRLLRVYTWVASLLDTVNYPLALRTVVTPSSPNARVRRFRTSKTAWVHSIVITASDATTRIVTMIRYDWDCETYTSTRRPRTICGTPLDEPGESRAEPDPKTIPNAAPACPEGAFAMEGYSCCQRKWAEPQTQSVLFQDPVSERPQWRTSQAPQSHPFRLWENTQTEQRWWRRNRPSSSVGRTAQGFGGTVFEK